MDDLLNSLQGKFKGEVQTAGNVLEKFSIDTSIFRVTPQVVVSPQDSADLQTLVSWVASQKKNNSSLSLTARAAGTDMTGGPLTDSIVVDVMKHFNHIVEIGPDYVIVEPGVFYRDLERELDKRNIFFPSYPASKDWCALGGMIANNAGGEKTLLYGKTDKYISSLQMVLADGKEYAIEPLDSQKSKSRTTEKTFVGKIYKSIYELLSTNYDLLKRSRPTVSKNSSGYNVWDVMGKDGSMDLTKMLVGSQGTLGLITQAKLKLVPKSKLSKLFVVFLRNLDNLPQFTQEILDLRPSSLEITDDHTFKLYLKYASEMAQVLGAGGIFQTVKLFMPEVIMMATSGTPKLILLVEFEGDDEGILLDKIEFLRKVVSNYHLSGHFCKTELEVAKYWKMRRDTFKLLREKIKGVYPAAFIDDLIVRPEYLSEFLPKLTEILDKTGVTYTISGHLGDGNLHIIPLMDIKKEETRKQIVEITQKVYDLVLKFHGSLSAEHNDGLIRGDWLEKEFGLEVYNIFKQIKQIFDPQNIFNPHKKTDSSHDYMNSHMRTS